MKSKLSVKKLSSLSLIMCLIPGSIYAAENARVTTASAKSTIAESTSSISENYSQRKDVQQFIEEMHKKHKFNVAQLSRLMQGVTQQKTALEAIARPAEGKPWKEYRDIFITDSRINKGVDFWIDNGDLLSRAEKKYGVPAEIIVAIIGVETYYGKHAGTYPVLDALTTLSFDYPPRASFFRKQLEHYLLMAREEKLDVTKLTGSYAGAMGMPQFIPSSFRSYAVDFDGDGVRDFWKSSADPIGSVANYFSRHGWKQGYPVVSEAALNKSSDGLGSKEMKPHKTVADYKKLGVKSRQRFADADMATLLKLDGKSGDEYWLALNNFYVITRYNHSPLYAMAVFQLSQAISTKYQETLDLDSQ